MRIAATALMLLLALVGCEIHTRKAEKDVTFKVTNEGEGIFKLERSVPIEDIVVFGVMSVDNKLLWCLKMSGRSMLDIQYGEVPVGNPNDYRMKPKQSTPEVGPPVPLKAGDEIMVYFEYPWDIGMAPSTKSEAWKIVVPNEGESAWGVRE